MEMNHLVSIIIPTYNRGDLIGETIESCLSQTYKNIEILVIDDGSDDHTQEVLRSYIERNQITYVYNQKQGISRTRNQGLDLAKGKYIQLLDSDDLIEETKIEKQVRFLESNPECEGVYCLSTYFRGEKNNIISKSNIAHSGEIFEELLKGSFIPTLTMLFKRNEKRFDESFSKCEDWDFWLQLTENGKKIGVIKEYLSFVRLHENNTSKKSFEMWEAHLRVLNKWETNETHLLNEKVHAEYGLFLSTLDYSIQNKYLLLNELFKIAIRFNMRLIKILIQYFRKK